MILVNGKPKEFSINEITALTRSIAFLQPNNPAPDPLNGGYSIPAGTGITTSYVMRGLGGASERVQYYERTWYDDSNKKDIFEPHNIMIQSPHMFIKSRPTQYEFNWFMLNHPGNHDNDLRVKARESGQRDPYEANKIEFRTHDEHRAAREGIVRMRVKNDLLDKFLDGKSTSWNFKQLVAAIGQLTGAADPTVHFPPNMLNYLAFEDKDHEILRAALCNFIEYGSNARFAYDLLIKERNQEIQTMVLSLLDNEKKSGFSFNATERKFYFINASGKKEVFASVPGNVKKEPTVWLVDLALRESTVMNELVRFGTLDLLATK